MAHHPLESLQTAPLCSNSSLPLGPRRNPPSRHNNLVRHNDSPFLPRRHRMRIRSWSPPLPLLLLPPPRNRFTNRSLSRRECSCQCLWRSIGLWFESYYFGDCTVEIVVYFGGGADLSFRDWDLGLVAG